MDILFVCTGNICRSPIAEALMKKKYEDFNIEGSIDSAGFSPTTINDSPDPRAIKAAGKKGIELSGSSRLFSQDDFDRYDRIYVMDAKNYNDVRDFSRNRKDMLKVDYLMNIMEPGTDKTIPDPIHSGTITFDDTITLIDRITTKLAEEIR